MKHIFEPMPIVHTLGAFLLSAFEVKFFVDNSGGGWVNMVLFGGIAFVFAVSSVLLYDKGQMEHSAKCKALAIVISAFSVISIASVSVVGLNDYRATDTTSNRVAIQQTIQQDLLRERQLQEDINGLIADSSTKKLALSDEDPAKLLRARDRITIATDKAIKVKEDEKTAKQKEREALQTQLDSERGQQGKVESRMTGFVVFAESIGHPEWVQMLFLIFYIARSIIFTVVTFATGPHPVPPIKKDPDMSLAQAAQETGLAAYSLYRLAREGKLKQTHKKPTYFDAESVHELAKFAMPRAPRSKKRKPNATT